MEGAGTNAFEVEILLVPIETLIEVTRSKIVKLPKPKAAHTRKGTMSTQMAQI